VAIYPATGAGLAPGGLLIQATEAFRNKALVFLLFVPDRTFCSVHHLIGTDDGSIAPVQETFEKWTLLAFQGDCRF